MGIGSVTSTNSISVMQMTPASLKDQKSKSIQNEITDVQQQIQKLSSTEDLSVNEKAAEQKKLQKEVSDLNTELKQHQEELRRAQKREIMLVELQEDNNSAKEEDSEDKIHPKETSSDHADEKNLPTDAQQPAHPGTVITQNSDGTVILKEIMEQDKNSDIGIENKQADAADEETAVEKEPLLTDTDTAADANLSGKDMQAMVSADASIQQAGRQGTVIARIKDGIAILKGEIKQDERRDVNTERKQAELEKMQTRKQRATAFQFSVLGEADDAMKSATETNGFVRIQDDTENTLYISGLNVSQEEQAAQQRFYVSIG